MQSKKLLGAALAVSMCAMIQSAASAASILQNGSFELGTNPGGSFATLNAGNASISNWTVGGAGVDYIGGYWNASNGNRSVDLSALSAGSVSQSLSTIAGTSYNVTFDMAGNFDGGNQTKQMRVDFGSTSEVFTFNRPLNWSRSSMGFESFTMAVTAPTSNTLLKFTSLEENPFGAVLDNVGIGVRSGGTTSAVPLPASAVGGSVLMVAMTLARKRRAVATV